MRRRLGGAGRPVRVVDEAEVMAVGASHLLVEVLATSPVTALVPAETADLRWGLPDAAFWLVAPVDRILPARSFAVLAERTDPDDTAVIPLAEVDRVAGPGGLDSPDRLAARLDCPLAPELLRL
jgi:hypothetical protein